MAPECHYSQEEGYREGGQDLDLLQQEVEDELSHHFHWKKEIAVWMLLMPDEGYVVVNL